MKLKLELINNGRIEKTRVVEVDDQDAMAMLLKESQHDPLSPGRNTFGTWVQVTISGD